MKIFTRTTLSSFFLLLLACKNNINMDKKDLIAFFQELRISLSYECGDFLSSPENTTFIENLFEGDTIKFDTNKNYISDKYLYQNLNSYLLMLEL